MNSSDSIIANPQLDEHLIAFISSINNNPNLFHNRNIFSLKSVTDTQLDHLLAINQNDVKRFSLANQSLSHKGIRQIFKPNWQNLIIIQMNNNMIASKGCKFLSKGNWPKLEQLIISKNKIDSCGLRHLVKVNWKNMKLLVLDDNLIDQQGSTELLRCNWKQVELLNLQSNRLKKSDVMNILRLDMPQMHWLQLRNQMNEQLASVRFLIVRKYCKLDLRQLSL